MCLEIWSVSALSVMKDLSVTHVHKATLVHHQSYSADRVTAMETLILMCPTRVTERLVSVCSALIIQLDLNVTFA